MTTKSEEPPRQATEPIRGKVAAIVSNRAIAINRGSDDGVQVGTRFAVLYPKAVEELVIVDPDTGEPLGEVDLPKVVVKIFRVVGPHLSVARTYRSIPGTKDRPPIFAAANLFGGSPGTPDRHETLDVDDQDRLDRKIDPEESFVEIGDPVVEVRGDEFDGYSDFR